MIFLRSLLVSVALAAGIAGLMTDARGGRLAVFGGPPLMSITGVSFGAPFQMNGTQPSGRYLDGDTYGNTWCADGVAYSLINDTLGPQGAGPSNNMGFGSVSSFDSTVTWTTVNPMTPWGTQGQNGGAPSASFKSGGLICVADNLYILNWRLLSGNGTQYDGNLVKSVDHGANWTPVPPGGAQPYAAPIFPGSTGLPFSWVQYGQNYAAGPDNSGTYVYATVYNGGYGGPPADADNRLARVKISLIANQSAADWSYYQGGDGMLDASWGALGTAAGIIPASWGVGNLSGIQYLPRYHQYVSFAYVPAGTFTSYLSVLVAYHPWGPWQQVGRSPNYVNTNLTWNFIAPKSLVNGGQSLVTIASSSNYLTGCTPTAGYYCLYMLPVTFTP